MCVYYGGLWSSGILVSERKAVVIGNCNKAVNDPFAILLRHYILSIVVAFVLKLLRICALRIVCKTCHNNDCNGRHVNNNRELK